MFTGIIEQRGRIIESRPVPGGRRIRVDLGSMASECKPGASICISGVCLTVTGSDGSHVDFDVIQETLAKTSLGSKQVGESVNIERSLRAGDRLDGHFVQGHVDGTAEIVDRLSNASEFVFWLEPQTHLLPFIIPKGSVAIDGVSLTIARVEGRRFSVALIPTTLDLTTLAALNVGDIVNIESDILARTIVHRVNALSDASGIPLQKFSEAGLL